MLHTEQLLMVGGSHIMRNYEHLLFEGTGRNPHVVRIFPTPSCTCPTSGSSCYHIQEAKISIGMEDINLCHKVSLTMLCKNIQSKKDKTSERKRLRVDDYDIIADQIQSRIH